MFSTEQITSMRRYIKGSSHMHFKSLNPNFIIFPLKSFPKLGRYLHFLYLIYDKMTNKMQLWHCNMPWNDSYYQNTHNKGSMDCLLVKALKHYNPTKVIPFEFDEIHIIISPNNQSDDQLSNYSFIIELNDKKTLYRIFQPRDTPIKWYNEIIFATSDYLLALDDSGSYILDVNGETISQIDPYTFVRSINDTSFIAELDGKRCIVDIFGNIIVPVIIGEFINYTDNEHYLARNDNKYHIVDFNGNIISEKYDIIVNHNTKHILAQKDNVYFIIDFRGTVMFAHADYMTAVRQFWSI